MVDGEHRQCATYLLGLLEAFSSRSAEPSINLSGASYDDVASIRISLQRRTNNLTLATGRRISAADITHGWGCERSSIVGSDAAA